mgnify:CR=1 FL=1
MLQQAASRLEYETNALLRKFDAIRTSASATAASHANSTLPSTATHTVNTHPRPSLSSLQSAFNNSLYPIQLNNTAASNSVSTASTTSTTTTTSTSTPRVPPPPPVAPRVPPLPPTMTITTAPAAGVTASELPPSLRRPLTVDVGSTTEHHKLRLGEWLCLRRANAKAAVDAAAAHAVSVTASAVVSHDADSGDTPLSLPVVRFVAPPPPPAPVPALPTPRKSPAFTRASQQNQYCAPTGARVSTHGADVGTSAVRNSSIAPLCLRATELWGSAASTPVIVTCSPDTTPSSHASGTDVSAKPQPAMLLSGPLPMSDPVRPFPFPFAATGPSMVAFDSTSNTTGSATMHVLPSSQPQQQRRPPPPAILISGPFPIPDDKYAPTLPASLLSGSLTMPLLSPRSPSPPTSAGSGLSAVPRDTRTLRTPTQQAFLLSGPLPMPHTQLSPPLPLPPSPPLPPTCTHRYLSSNYTTSLSQLPWQSPWQTQSQSQPGKQRSTHMHWQSAAVSVVPPLHQQSAQSRFPPQGMMRPQSPPVPALARKLRSAAFWANYTAPETNRDRIRDNICTNIVSAFTSSKTDAYTSFAVNRGMQTTTALTTRSTGVNTTHSALSPLSTTVANNANGTKRKRRVRVFKRFSVVTSSPPRISTERSALARLHSGLTVGLDLVLRRFMPAPVSTTVNGSGGSARQWRARMAGLRARLRRAIDRMLTQEREREQRATRRAVITAAAAAVTGAGAQLCHDADTVRLVRELMRTPTWAQRQDEQLQLQQQEQRAEQQKQRLIESKEHVVLTTTAIVAALRQRQSRISPPYSQLASNTSSARVNTGTASAVAPGHKKLVTVCDNASATVCDEDDADMNDDDAKSDNGLRALFSGMW